MTFKLGYCSMPYYPLEKYSKFELPIIYLLKDITSKHAIFEYCHIRTYYEMSTFWYFKILAFVIIVFIKSINVWNVTLHNLNFFGIE